VLRWPDVSHVDVDAGVDDDRHACRSPELGDPDGLELGVDEPAGPMVGIFEVAADRSSREEAVRELGGWESVAGLDVGRHRHLHCLDDPRHRGEHRVDRCSFPIAIAEALGDGRACGRDRKEPSRLDGARTRRVPCVWQDERPAGDVEVPEMLGLRRESVHHR